LIRSKPTSYAARALERSRRRRKGRPPPKQALTPKHAITQPELLSETLIITFPLKEDRPRWGLAAGVALHVVVLAFAILAPILWPPSPPPPVVVRTFFDSAPPPPPLPRRGSPIVLRKPYETPAQPQPDRLEQPQERATFIEEEVRVPLEIPEEILTPQIEIQFGVEDGFDLGDIEGMEGGVPGGVVGGVPGGIVGGIVGGTGTEVYPQPDVPPRPLRTPRPSYTVEAIRKKITGDVILQVVIDTQGQVKVLKILRSIPELDEEAIRVVENEWRFRPALKNNRPVPTLAELLVTFNLF